MITNATEGTRSEYLAFFAMSCIGYVTPVPRQADTFGVDCFVYLATPEGKYLTPTGPAIAVQVKSNDDALSLNTPHRRAAFFEISTPLFIAVVDKSGQTLELYETSQRKAYARLTEERTLDLVLGSEPEGFKNAETESRWKYYLGAPVWSGPLDQLDGEEKGAARDDLRKTMEWWGVLDATNAALFELGIPAGLRGHPPPSGAWDIAVLQFRHFVGPALAANAMFALMNISGIMQAYLAESLERSPLTVASIGRDRMVALRKLMHDIHQCLEPHAAAARRARNTDAGA